MSFLNVTDNATHITNVRSMLQQAGVVQSVTIEKEEQIVYSGSSGQYIHVFNVPTADCAGIWNNISASGTNYYNTNSGSSVDENTGKLVLFSGSDLSIGDTVFTTYMYQVGLTDNQIMMEIESAKRELNAEFDMSWTFEVTTDNVIERLAIMTMYAIATKFCILTLNSSNAIQGGSSFRIGDVDVQTKLWGEGMSVDILFKTYERKITSMKNNLKLAYYGAPVVIINRRSISAPYQNRAFPANAHRTDVLNAAIFSDSGKIYVVGGETIYEGWLSSMSIYDG